MEALKLYAPKGHVTPLTVSDKPGPFSLETVALNLMRMSLMDKSEEMTAEKAFAALDGMPHKTKAADLRRWKGWLTGNDKELSEMYEAKELSSLNGQECVPVPSKEETLELLNENPLTQFLEENLPYESPYV